jgi:hypothetical protein
MITLKRMGNGRHAIFENGEIVGRAWKWPREKGFGICLNGIYWRGDGLRVPNREGGCTTTTVPRLKDVPGFVGGIISSLSTKSKGIFAQGA